jgi:uncharacterized membrane protein YdjX (TVP38/TMEM64 family)
MTCWMASCWGSCGSASEVSEEHPVSSPGTRPASPHRTTQLQRLGALLVVVLVTLIAVLFRDRLSRYEEYGYVGVFAATLLGSASVVLPVPGLAIVYVAGSIWNPLAIGLIAALGDTIGEATGYLAGYAGQGIVENSSLYNRFAGWMSRHGFLTILILSAVPNPFFDMAGIAAGASRFSARRFFLATWIGKTVKDVTVAVAGFYSLALFADSVLPAVTSVWP